MVAIVTGNGVGLGKSSAEVLGQGGQLGLGQLPGAAGNAYVNAATGNLIIQRQDELLIGQGPDIGVYQTYNSQGISGSDFDNNDNWQVSLYRQLSGLAGGAGVNTAGSTITRTGADGTAVVYTYDSTAGSVTLGKYINKDGSGSYDTLTYASGTNTWVWQDGDTRIKESYAVDPNNSNKWRIISVTDLDNNSLTYSYNTTTGLTGLIDTVTDASNEVTKLVYNNSKQLTRIDVIKGGVTSTRVSYTYDNNRLSVVTTDLTPENTADNNVYTTSYTYVDSTSTRIASITNSDGSKVSFTYETSGLFRLLTISDYVTNSSTINNTTTISYTNATTTKVTNTNSAGTDLVTTLTYDATTKQLTNIQGPLNSGQNVSYIYNSNGDVIQVTDSRGNWTKYTYDAQGNQLSSQDNLGNTVTRTYGSNNELLTQTLYTVPDANVSDATLAASGAQTTRYTYDSNNHVRFVISAEGRVTEYRYNAQGQLSSAHQYTDHLNTSTGNQTEAVMNTWLTAAIKSKSQRTDYLYDPRGQLREQIVYTKVDATAGSEGNGIIDGTQMRTQYVYDQFGNLTQKIDARGVASGTANDYMTSYGYDGLNRLTLTKQYDATGLEANAVSTQVTYTDTSRQVKLTLANGLVTTSTYDLAGRLTSVQKTDSNLANLGTTSYAYDKLGNLRMVTDPAGQNTYYLYDNANRKVGEIDPNKNLTEWIYNNNGQVIRTAQYKSAVTAALNATTALTNTLTTSGIKNLDTTNDRVSRKLYDAAGRLAKEIDGLGYVTEYQYDGASRLLKTIQYANALNATQVNAINAASTELLPTNSNTVPVADSTNDRVNRNLYDNDGKLLGSLDAEGYLTEYIYDKASRQIQKKVYATATTAANRANGALALLKSDATNVSADSDKHQTTNYIYDAAGQLTGIVDAENFLTEYQYDLVGNKTQEIRYATSITYVAGNTVIQSRPASNNEDQKITNTYDANNRLTSSLSNTQGQANGLLTNYTYDNVGNLTQAVKTFTGATSDQERAQRRQYDSRGNLIAELSGEGVVALRALGATPTTAQVNNIWNNYATRYSYDAAGRLISKLTPDGTYASNAAATKGNKTLYYYDNEGKLTYTINALGEVSQTVYNSFDQIAETRRYNNRIASATLAGLVGGDESAMTSVITGIGATNVSNIQLGYDKRGQLISTTDELLNINSRSYNAFGELNNRTDKIDSSTSALTSYQYDRRGALTQTKEDDGGINRITQAVYDAFGRVTQTTDGRGNNITHVYDRLGSEVTTTDALSKNTVITYDAFSRVLKQTDRNNTTAGTTNGVTYVYNSTTRTMTMTTAEGVVVVTTKNQFGDTVSIKDGLNNTTSYEYNADGQLTRTITPDTAETSVYYDTAGRVWITADANGIETVYRYDAANRLFSKRIETDGPTYTTLYYYDAQGRQNWTRDARSVWTRMDYDAKGQVTMVVVDPLDIPTAGANGIVIGTAPNSTGLNLTTSYTYDARGKKLTVTEGAGTSAARTTRYDYDKLGRLKATVIDPGGSKLNLTTSYTYDQNDNVALKTDANGNKTVYKYDANNRLEYTVDALGYVKRNFYDANGNIIKTREYKNALAAATLATLQGAPATTTVTIADNNDDRVTRYGYDKDNRLTYTTNAEWFVTRNEYDANGNVVKRTAHAVKATAISETGGAPTVANNANDRIEQTVYDTVNQPIYTIDAEKYVTRLEYDLSGNVIKKTRYATALTALPAIGVAPSLVSSGKDQVTQYVYDNVNRLTDETRALGSTEEVTTHYDYDYLGNQTQITEAYGTANARVTQQKFDKAGRKTEVIDGEGKSTKTEYNAAGDIVKVIDALGNAGYFYMDAAGRVTLQVDPEGAVTQTLYDGLGNVSQVLRFAGKVQISGTGALNASAQIQVGGTPPSNGVYVATDVAKDQKQTIEYDKLGQKLFVKTWTGATDSTLSSAYYTEGYTYTAFGDIETQTARNGLVTVYTYDKQSRKKSESFTGILVRNPADNGTVTLKNTFTYNAFGNMLTQVEADGALTTRTTAFVNDKLGRQIQSTQNVQTTAGISAPAISQKTFDARGNVVAEKDTNGNWTYTYYDKQDRRIASAKADGSYTVWEYDALGNITKQTQYANKIQTSGTGTLSATSTIQPVGTAPTNSAVFVIADAANDRVTEYTYDKVGRQTGTKISNVTTGVYITATQQYVVGTDNITTKTDYDALGNAIKQTDGNGNVTRSWYNKAGQLLAKLDAEGYLIVWDRDVYSNISKETRYAIKPANAGTNPLTVSDATVLTQLLNTATTLGSTDDRITNIVYDKLNRVSTEAVLNVQAGSVSATGILTAATPTNLITNYLYDGLNNIVQKTDAASAVTNWVYDGLGRQMSVINPQFSDYQGATIRTRTDKEYDGLNNVTRELRRGTNDAPAATLSGQVESDDQITTYIYGAGGRLISEKDATEAVIQYEYDLNGNITKQTLKGRRNADQIAAGTLGLDDVTTYTYDSLNRQTKTTDLGTTVVQEVQYNSFNQVTQKRTFTTITTPTAWDEYSQYDLAGRVWKSSSGDGVTKVYINDKSGNATAMISSTLDIKVMTLMQVLMQRQLDTQNNVAQQTMYTFSVYDRKNQLLTTVQPSMDSTRGVLGVQQNSTDQSVFVGGSSTVGAQGTLTLYTVKENSDVAPGVTLNESKNNFSFAMIRNDGSVVAWGDPGRGGSLLFVPGVNGVIPVTQIYSSGTGFAALRSNGSVVIWGWSEGYMDSVNTVGTIPTLMNGDVKVVDVYSTSGAGSFPGEFAALREDGSIVSYEGFGATGEIVSGLDGNIKSISVISNPMSFAALRENGSVVTWGYGLTGGTMSPTVASQLNDSTIKVIQIYPTGTNRTNSGFIALREDGSLVSWGTSSYYINSGIPKVTKILGNGIAQRADGSIVTWSTTAGQSGQFTLLSGSYNGSIQFTQQFYGKYLLTGNGALTTWLTDASFNAVASQLNGTIKVINVYSTGTAYAALREDGSVITWGSGSGSDSSSVANSLNGVSAKVVQIHTTSRAGSSVNGGFAALLDNGSVVSWGAYPLSASQQTALNGTIKVTSIYSTAFAFAALREDGSIINWGNVYPVDYSPPPAGAFDSGNRVGSSIYTATFVVPGTLHITEPVSTAFVDISYRRTNSTGEYTTVRVNPVSLGSGLFDWDPLAIVQDSANQTGYSLQIRAYNTDGVVTNQTSTTLVMGASGITVSNTSVTAVQTLRIKPSQTGISYVRLGYRVKGSTSDYIMLPANYALSTNADSSKEYRFELPTNLTPGDYEYTYTAYAADTVVNGNTVNNQLGSATDYFTAGNNGTVIQRSQTYNAFGEIISEIDGRGNITSYTYNTMGAMTKKTDPTVSITLANGAQQNHAPITEYTYDALGRVIAIKDANTNVNTQVWLAGSTNSNHIVFEKHADGGIKSTGFDIFGNKRAEYDEQALPTNRNFITTTSLTAADLAHRIDYTYDNENRLIRVDRQQRAEGTRSYDLYGYDVAGNRISHTTSTNVSNATQIANTSQTEKTYLDSLGRVTKTISFQGIETTYSFAYMSDIAGVGGATVSGWQKTTTDAMGRTLIDKMDMFNHVTWHQDLGGHQFIYTYNQAGWLTSQTSVGSGAQFSGQNIAYEYYNNGNIKAIHDKAVGMYTYYEYDKDGNRTFEGYINLKDASNLVGGAKDYYQYATISYDAMNRMISVVDPKATITYEYDAVGNRRMSKSVYYDAGVNGTRQTQEYWYTYDSMNRFLITMGKFNGTRGSGTIGLGATSTSNMAVSISYNLAGQRTQAIYASNNNTEKYAYTNDGYLTDVKINDVVRSSRVNDALGRVITYKENNTSGSQIYIKETTYDKDSRVTNESGTDGTTDYYYYAGRKADGSDEAANIAVNGKGALAKVYNDSNGAAAGGTLVSTYYAYEYWDDAKQFAITNQGYDPVLKGNNAFWKPGYSELKYDVNGHLIGANDAGADGSRGTADDRSFRYVNDAQGLILLRDEIAGSVVNKVQRYYYVNGKRVGDVGSDGFSRTDYAQAMASRGTSKSDYKNWKPVSSADFDQNYEPISPIYPGAVPSTYTIKSGETLQSIAQAVWGDASMWYLIADANGLASDTVLVAGQMLTIPNKVTNIHNNSGTFRVYNPGEAIGDVNPTLPTAPPVPKPKKKGGCGGIATIIIAVVAVVAAVYLGPLVAGALGAAQGGTAAVMISAGVGSIAGQVAGNALGVQQGFDFKSFGIAIATAGIANGVMGNVTAPTSALGKAIESGFGTSYAAIAARAVVGNVIGQGIGNITGAQKGFSWSSVAIAGIGATAAAFATNQMGLTQFDAQGQIQPRDTAWGTDFGIAVVNNGAFALTQLVVKGGKINWQQVAADTITDLIQSRVQSNAIEKSQIAESAVQQMSNKQSEAQRNMVADAPQYTKSTMSDALTPEEEIRYRQIQEAEKSNLTFSEDFELRKQLANEAALYNATKPTVSFVDYALGVGEIFLGGTYNLGVAAGAGTRGIAYAITGDIDGAVNAIRESQDAAGYQLRSSGAKAILDSSAVKYVAGAFNESKKSLGDLGFEYGGATLGAVGYTTPDAVALILGPKITNVALKGTVTGLRYTYDALAPIGLDMLRSSPFLSGEWANLYVVPNKGYIPNAGSVGNMGEFLKAEGFGNAIAGVLTKTSKIVKGESVYKVNQSLEGIVKKGDQVYLDSLHMNHLEVFSKNNKFLKVLNLDGTINRIKTDAGQGGTIPK
jgi:YD repeat-containing protein